MIGVSRIGTATMGGYCTACRDTPAVFAIVFSCRHSTQTESFRLCEDCSADLRAHLEAFDCRSKA